VAIRAFKNTHIFVVIFVYIFFRNEDVNSEEKENKGSTNHFKRPRTKYSSESQCKCLLYKNIIKKINPIRLEIKKTLLTIFF